VEPAGSKRSPVPLLKQSRNRRVCVPEECLAQQERSARPSSATDMHLYDCCRGFLDLCCYDLQKKADMLISGTLKAVLRDFGSSSCSVSS
jgi:hypothetical protein